MMDELYTLLGVSRDATAEEIKKAYRKAARTNHPDLNPGDSAAEDRFKRIAAAYEVLGNTEKRAIYDEFGPEAEAIGYDSERAEEYRQWKRRAEAAARAGGGFGHPGGRHTTQDMEDLLSELFRRQGRRAAQPRGGGDIEAVLRVPFRDAVLGTKARVSVPRPDGSMADLNLTVPAGVEDGQRLRLGGQGQPGFGEGAPAGDLYVRLEVESHPAFERRGDDLHLTLPVTVPEALVGAKVEVPLLVGSVSVKVPAGSKSGGKLRLRGKGVQSKKRGAGDLILTLEIVMPDGGDEAERARLAEELRQLYRDDARATLRQEVKR